MQNTMKKTNTPRLKAATVLSKMISILTMKVWAIRQKDQTVKRMVAIYLSKRSRVTLKS